MNPSAHLEGALVELLNTGCGRTGAALSRLTGQRVLLEVPNVAIHPVGQLNASLGRVVDDVVDDRVASIRQVFSGPVAGDALLILNPVAAIKLKELLTGEPALPLELDSASREVLTEVGNILLDGCIGTFGNLLKVPVSFSVPDIDVASLSSVVDTLPNGDGMRYALVITTRFRLRDAEVSGYVVIVLSAQSLTKLLLAVEEQVRGQH